MSPPCGAAFWCTKQDKPGIARPFPAPPPPPPPSRGFNWLVHNPDVLEMEREKNYIKEYQQLVERHWPRRRERSLRSRWMIVYVEKSSGGSKSWHQRMYPRCVEGLLRRPCGLRHRHWLHTVSTGSNPVLGMWESWQWLEVRRWFSQGTPVSSTVNNWLVTN